MSFPRRALVAAGFAAAVALPLTTRGWVLPDEAVGDPWLVKLGASTGIRTHALGLVTVAEGTVRTAHWRCGPETVFEVGSVSKALTGLAIADLAERVGLSLDDPLGRYLDLGSSPAAAVTVRAAATHTSGLPRGVTRRRGASWSTPYLRVGVATLCADARAVTTLGKPTFSYSNLGASLAGWAAAHAAGTTYPDLMAARVFQPLGMTSSAAQFAGPLAPRGHAGDGQPVPQLVADGYAPMGALVSTTADLTRLLQALVEKRSPGQSALNPLVPSGAGHEGLLWDIQPYEGGRVAAHPGGTPGYAAYLAVDAEHGRGVAVLADQSGAGVEFLGKTILEQLP
ncbi:MAG TPA: serine hydrolase domain-containing protein [Propionibacteriaceae bacterium]|nr:serine hydrolase domain-containing protein [Propionibacteriaceae bacterium]